MLGNCFLTKTPIYKRTTFWHRGEIDLCFILIDNKYNIETTTNVSEVYLHIWLADVYETLFFFWENVRKSFKFSLHTGCIKVSKWILVLINDSWHLQNVVFCNHSNSKEWILNYKHLTMISSKFKYSLVSSILKSHIKMRSLFSKKMCEILF